MVAVVVAAVTVDALSSPLLAAATKKTIVTQKTAAVAVAVADALSSPLLLLL